MWKKKNIRNRRNTYWLINMLLYYLLRINPFRDKRLWLFGCWEGNKYSDNSRYLFEYVNQHHKEITCIWITKSKDVYMELKKKNYIVCMNNSLEGIYWQLKCGVAFYTNGIDDFSNISFIYGAKIVALWHGTGMKNVYYAKNSDSKSLKFMLKKIKDKMFSWVYRDISIATSKISRHNLAVNLLLKEKDIFITGYPRNDVFKLSLCPHDILKGITNADQYSYILVMPTHRPYPSDHIEQLINIIRKSSTLQQTLVNTNTIILLKLHYLEIPKCFDPINNFYLLEDKDISSSMELLAIADCLVTDYSSCITDFSIQEKPIVIFAPDYQEYRKRVGLNLYWSKLIPEYSIKDENSLVMELIKISNILFSDKIENKRNCDLTLRNIIHESYEDISLHRTVYSENVYKLITEVL